MKKLALLPASLMLALSVGSTANAALITRTFDLTGTDFSVYFGDGSVPPEVDPVHLNFTITADDSAPIAPTTSGLTINSFNLPYALEYAYDGSGILTIATDAGISSCGHPAFSFCAFIGNAFGATPNLFFVEQSPASGGWKANTVALTIDAPAVPEPATWAMMLAGFGAIGFAMRRRRNVAVSFA